MIKKNFSLNRIELWNWLMVRGKGNCFVDVCVSSVSVGLNNWLKPFEIVSRLFSFWQYSFLFGKWYQLTNYLNEVKKLVIVLQKALRYINYEESTW